MTKLRQLRARTSGFPLFELSEQLIELILSHTAVATRVAFIKVFGEDDLTLRALLHRVALPDIIAPWLPFDDYVLKFGKYVHMLLLRDMTNRSSFDILAGFTSCRTLLINMRTCPITLFYSLGKMLALQTVRLVATKAPEPKQRTAIDWINYVIHSGRKMSIEWESDVEDLDEFDKLHSILSDISNNSRVRFAIKAPYSANVGQCFQQLAPQLSRLEIHQPPDESCFGADVEAVFGNEDIAFVNLASLALPICCCNLSFAPAKYPSLSQLHLHSIQANCSGARRQHIPAVVAIFFGSVWSTITECSISISEIETSTVVGMVNQMPMLANFTLSTKSALDVAVVMPHMPYIRQLVVEASALICNSAQHLSKSLAVNRHLFKLCLMSIKVNTPAIQFILNLPSLRSLELIDLQWTPDVIHKYLENSSPATSATVWNLVVDSDQDSCATDDTILALCMMFPSLKTVALPGYPIATLTLTMKAFPSISVSARSKFL
ncbi:hypothetical protein GQ42DRAFT_165173 [Ramicandelaber brevisporus]|nr:hypothetical protein GQ42DRAFT_165173 [Ramicandelaber brevisporus]